MLVTMKEPYMIRTKGSSTAQTKINIQKSRALTFDGYDPEQHKTAGTLISPLKIIGTCIGVIVGAAVGSAIALGFNGTTLMFVVRLMETCGFFSNLIFFNVKYSHLISSVLETIYESINSKYLSNPINKLVANRHDMAGHYHYKLSRYHLAPYYFQDAVIEILPILFVNLLSFLVWLCQSKAGQGCLAVKIHTLRFNLFITYWVDITFELLMTILHFGEVSHSDLNGKEWISIVFSMLWTSLYILEVMFIYQNTSSQRFTENKGKDLKGIEKFYRDAYYDGVNKKALNRFFIRNYNILFLFRFQV
jgi:hypothetical protein